MYPLILFIISLAFNMASGNVSPPRKPKVILDVDPGVDDAHGLLMMFSQASNHSILALTISQGNTFLSNATHNALRILRLCNQLEIPIFKGDKYTLDGQVKNTSIYFGPNGFGNVADDTFDYSQYLQQPENASQALIRLANTFPNEITLIALGTQTNIARAIEQDPDFGKKLKDCVIMGGNYLGIGNESPKAEFNFLIDPKAANEVLKTLNAPITIITWELCLNHSVPWSWYDNWVSKESPKAKFMGDIGKFGRDRAIRKNEASHLLADQIAVAVYLDPSIILQSQMIVATVETSNPYNIGEMIVDWENRAIYRNLKLVTKVDLTKILGILYNSV